MKKLSSLFVLIIFAFTATKLQAQEVITLPDSISGWNYNWVAGINGSQAAYSNWSKGGVNSISGNASSTISGKYREGRFAYGVLLGTRYGKTKNQDQGVRKTDDLILLKNRFLYDLSEEESDFSLYGDIDFRTQFDEGFEYGEDPGEEDEVISRFLAPAYLSENAGLAYVPNDIYSFSAGLGLKQTIVTDDDLETLYGLDEGESFRNEAGITLGATYEQVILPNFLLSSSLGTFTNVVEPISDTDVYFANQLTGRVNRFINVSLRFDLVYDEDFSEEVQTLQVLSLGVSFVLI